MMIGHSCKMETLKQFTLSLIWLTFLIETNKNNKKQKNKKTAKKHFMTFWLLLMLTYFARNALMVTLILLKIFDYGVYLVIFKLIYWFGIVWMITLAIAGIQWVTTSYYFRITFISTAFSLSCCLMPD